MRQPLTRETISAAARNILVAEGLHAVSLRRVAGHLGVTAPALYAHMIDKRDLLQGIVEQETKELLQRFLDTQAHGPIDRLRAMCFAYIDYGLENPDLFRAMFLLRPELTAEPRNGQPAVGERILSAFLSAVQRAHEQNAIDDGDPRLAALTLWTTAHGVVVTLLAGPPLPADLKEGLAEAAVSSAITGVRHGSLISVS